MNADEIRILVVDDDPDVVQGTARLLDRAGYVTRTASNGEEALRSVHAFHPHLVLTDRDMPKMDGMELCRRIKGDPGLADVFVVLISGTYTQSEEQIAGLNLGADGYILRPVANLELAARMEAFVRLLRLNRALREKNDELEAALAKVNLLSGLLPICAGCKQIRDDKGYWIQVESYIQKHSEATFTHGMCPKCIEKYYPDLEGEKT